MNTVKMHQPDLFDVVKKLLQQEAELRKDWVTPNEVQGGAVWTDRSGKLTGDLRTDSGSLSFSGATVGSSIPPDPQLNMPLPSCQAKLKDVGDSIRSLAELGESEEALRSLSAVRDALADCLKLAEEKISRLSERLEVADLLTPDTDPIRRLTDVVARRVRDDSPLSCDPDEHPND